MAFFQNDLNVSERAGRFTKAGVSAFPFVFYIKDGGNIGDQSRRWKRLGSNDTRRCNDRLIPTTEGVVEFNSQLTQVCTVQLNFNNAVLKRA